MNDPHATQGWRFVAEKVDARRRIVRLYRRGDALKRVIICTGVFRFYETTKFGQPKPTQAGRYLCVQHGSVNAPGDWK